MITPLNRQGKGDDVPASWTVLISASTSAVSVLRRHMFALHVILAPHLRSHKSGFHDLGGEFEAC